MTVSVSKGRNSEEIRFKDHTELQKRFKQAVQRSQDRQGLSELTHAEFMEQVLLVWELHERRMLEQKTESEANECGHYSDNYQP